MNCLVENEEFMTTLKETWQGMEIVGKPMYILYALQPVLGRTHNQYINFFTKNYLCQNEAGGSSKGISERHK